MGLVSLEKERVHFEQSDRRPPPASRDMMDDESDDGDILGADKRLHYQSFVNLSISLKLRFCL